MRRLALVLVAFAALAVPDRGSAQNIPVRVGGEASSLVGLPFDLPIVVDMSARTERLGSYAVRLSWNPAVLRLVGGADGSFGAATANTDSLPQGVIRFAGANPGGVSGVTTLLIGRLEPLRAETTTIHIAVTELFAAGTFTDLLPSAVVSDGYYCPGRGRYGDIDRDLSINSRDALIALSNAVGLDVSAFDVALGDVDASGATNARDALVILSSAVGLDVTAFRVNAIAAGACAAGALATLVITPGATGDVLPGQVIRFAATAREVSGVPQAATNVSWRTSNAAVVTVMSDGVAIARDTGTAIVTAVRDGRDSARVTVHVGPRRVHYVSAAAVSAVNQIGSQELPWADLSGSREMMSPGDTIIVLPGRYAGNFAWGAAIVLIGRSSGGHDAVLAGDGTWGPALHYDGSGTFEVHNLTIDGYDAGIEIGPSSSLLADSVRIFARPAPACADAGIAAWGGFQRITVRRSQFVGDGQWDGCANGIAADNGALLVVEDVTISDFGSHGIGAYNVDSVVVRRANINDNGYYGVGVGPTYYITTPPRAAPQPAAAAYSGSTALVVEDSRLLRNWYEAVYAEGLRFGRVSGSVVEMLDYDDALYVAGTPDGHGFFELAGDSIHMDEDGYDDWIDANGLDSVHVEGVRVVGAYRGYFYNVRNTRAQNSSFLLTYDAAFDVGVGSYSGPPINATLDLDSVHVVGLPLCGQCATGVYAYGTTVRINRFRGENLDYGVNHSDSSLTVTNSVIQNTYTGVYASAWSSPVPQLARIRNVTMTDVEYGVETANMTTVVDTLSFTRGWAGIEAWDGGADSVRASTITDAYYGVMLMDSAGYVADNTVLRPQGVGIDLDGPSFGPGVQFSVLRNTVTCDTYGADNAEAIDAYSAHLVINDNAISGCNGGISAGSGISPRTAVVRGNSVAVAPQADYPGIAVRQRYSAEVVGNTVTGGALYGDGSIHVGDDYSYRMPRARVDSNVVTTPLAYGIVANEVDTLQVFGNRVEDFTSGTAYYVAKGAIGLYGNFFGPVLVQGNTIRRSHGTGIAIDQVAASQVVVDSNAISGSDTAAVRVVNGHVWLTRNNIRNNLYGAYFATDYDGAVHRAEGNAFKGNALYAVYVDPSGYDSVDASGNWWGVDGEMPGAAGADSVYGRVGDASPLAAEPTALPPLASPIVLAVRPSPARPQPAEVAAAPSLPMERPAPRRAVRPARPAKPAATVVRRPENSRRPVAAAPQATVAGAPVDAAVAARQAALDARTRRDAERASRDSARTADRERHLSERRSAP